MKKKLLLTLVACFVWTIYSSAIASAKNGRNWTFNIEGISFDSLNAHFYGKFINYKILFEKQDFNTWTIHVPDSVYEKYDYLDLIGYQKETGWLPVSLLVSPEIIKYNIGNILHFSDNTIVNMDFFNQMEGEIFLTSSCADPEYLHSKKMASLFTELAKKDLSPDDAIQSIRQFLESNPGSVPTMKLLSVLLQCEVSLESIQSLYSIFTEDVKNIPHGRFLAEYLEKRKVFDNDKFQVFSLPRCDTNHSEPFITNNGGYKLVIFSAMWCKPCHEIIPIYKEIYNDLYEKLDMVYITIDVEENSYRWLDLLKKYEIPWRSYFSYNIEGDILEKYMLRSIPSAFLVFPDMTFKKIDVRREKERTELYNLVRDI